MRTKIEDEFVAAVKTLAFHGYSVQLEAIQRFYEAKLKEKLAQLEATIQRVEKNG